jgi:arylformamidase
VSVPPTYVDLSHPIESGMSVAPRLPSPRVEPYISHAASRSLYAGHAEFEITRLFLVGNTGTSLDSPYHRFPDRADVSGLGLDGLVDLPGLRVDAVGRRPQRSGISLNLPEVVLEDSAILIHTGWDSRWGTRPYWTGGPWLGRALVERLLEARPALVGVDFANVDDQRDPSRPVHTSLLDANIPILENLRGLNRLPPSGFRVSAPPPAVAGAATMPVRAFARIETEGALGTTRAAPTRSEVADRGSRGLRAH